jgi:hypothetical protein
LNELPECLTRHGEQTWLAVSVVPNAKRTGADGLHGGALRVRLAAPPVDGKANDVLVQWVAGELGLPRRAVTLVRGQSSRRKLVAVEATAPQVVAWLRGLLPPGQP